LNFQVPTINILVVEWWATERQRFRAADRRFFDGLVCTTAYTLWKNRNAWCFDNPSRQLSAMTMTQLILEECSYISARFRVADGVGVLDNG
jgi:hypothetical protein